MKYTVLKIYGKDKNILIGKHKLSITPAVMDITDVGETTTSWDAIEYVEAFDQYLFMLVRGSGPHIVPKKAFADDKAFIQFTETASAYHQASVAAKVRTNLDLQQS